MHQSDPTSILPDAPFGTHRTQRPTAWVGQGAAWLVHDAARDCYHCYWLVGPANAHLLEHTDALSAAVAVEWAQSRTPRARIRLPDHRTYWAGTDPSPGGFAGAWTAAGPTTTKSVPRNHASPDSRPDGLKGDIAGV